MPAATSRRVLAVSHWTVYYRAELDLAGLYIIEPSWTWLDGSILDCARLDWEYSHKNIPESKRILLTVFPREIRFIYLSVRSEQLGVRLAGLVLDELVEQEGEHKGKERVVPADKEHHPGAEAEAGKGSRPVEVLPGGAEAGRLVQSQQAARACPIAISLQLTPPK
eukprot:1195383-Prorocentrum_minimum.AAC.1